MDDRDGEPGEDTGEDAPQSPGPYPIEGPALVKTAALASVPAERLPSLLARVQADLGPRVEDYRRRYERIAAESDRETFLVEPDHWEAIGERLGLSDRERDAVARAHETAVERAGAGQTRREEFETALEIRSGVVIGTAEPDGGNADSETGTETGSAGDAPTDGNPG